MNNKIRILALVVGTIMLIWPAHADQPDHHDRAMALLATLAVLSVGEKTGDRVGWAGASGYSGAAVLISVASSSAILETQRQFRNSQVERESFLVARYPGQIWIIKGVWRFSVLKGPSKAHTAGCFGLGGELMLRNEYLLIEGTVCREDGHLKVRAASLRGS